MYTLLIICIIQCRVKTSGEALVNLEYRNFSNEEVSLEI